MEVLQGQIAKIRREITINPPNTKTLTMELSGSLMARKSRFHRVFVTHFCTEVNGGPLEICKVFLGDNMTKYNKAHVTQMIETFQTLIQVLLSMFKSGFWREKLVVDGPHLRNDDIILKYCTADGQSSDVERKYMWPWRCDFPQISARKLQDARVRIPEIHASGRAWEHSRWWINILWFCAIPSIR